MWLQWPVETLTCDGLKFLHFIKCRRFHCLRNYDKRTITYLKRSALSDEGLRAYEHDSEDDDQAHSSRIGPTIDQTEQARTRREQPLCQTEALLVDGAVS